ncbi:MAG TPA: hypothetical protein DD435_10115 [Cyanobacteria bacterium UBA8530]|nr:hypothetical protein [Cyanobacteria bacterium UBA8530]
MQPSLRRTIRNLKPGQDLDSLLQQIPQVIGHHLGYDRCLLFLNEGKRIEPVSLWIRQDDRDLLAHAPSLAEILLDEEARSEASLTGKPSIVRGCGLIPIRPIGEGESLGIIVVDRLASPIEEAELETLSLLADFLGLAILNARQLKEISLLHRISNLLSSSLELDVVLANLLKELSQILPVDHCEVLLHSNELGGLVLASCSPPDSEMTGRISPCSIAMAAFEGRKAVPLWTDCSCSERLRSGICTPLLLTDQEPFGVVCLGSRLTDAFAPSLLETVASICNQAAIAIHNAQQYQIQKDLEALKGEFLSTISHELRTPLTSIKGFTETLLKPEMDFPAEARQRILEIISRQTDHLSKLIEDILAVSRLEAANMALPVTETSLDEVIRQILDSLQDTLAPFEVTTNLAPLVLFVDRNKIAQVLINLIGNASKYTPKGRKIEVSLQEKGEGAVIRIADQGIGIPPESRPALFKKFSRLDNSLTRKTGGTGLGLYISAKLIEAHGGRIWIEDPPWGEGTCFGVFLPGKIS